MQHARMNTYICAFVFRFYDIQMTHVYVLTISKNLTHKSISTNKKDGNIKLFVKRDIKQIWLQNLSIHL